MKQKKLSDTPESGDFNTSESTSGSSSSEKEARRANEIIKSMPGLSGSRKSDELREKLADLTPEHRQTYRYGEEEDVTVECHESLRQLFYKIHDYVVVAERECDSQDELTAAESAMDEALGLLRYFGAECPTDDLIGIRALSREFGSSFPPETLFPYLRQTGILSNRPGTWNKASEYFISEGLLWNRLRVLRTKDGALLSRHEPYVTPSGKKWLMIFLGIEAAK